MTLVYPAKFDRLASRIGAVAVGRVCAQRLADQLAVGQESLGRKVESKVPSQEEATLVWTTPDGCFQVDSRMTTTKISNIYRATDRERGRPVVIKEAIKSVDEYLVRRENDFLRRLKHPNVVGVVACYDCYLVEEFLPGAELDRLILSPLEAMSVGFQLVDVMAHAHGIGIVIRDLKPENVMVTPDGQVKLFDLGLAKDLRQAKDIGRPGYFFGTSEYAAPEIILYGTSAARPVSDYYSLGVTLYRSMTHGFPTLRMAQVGEGSGKVSFPESGRALGDRIFFDIPLVLHPLLRGLLEVEQEDRLANPDQVQRMILEGLAELTLNG